MPSGADAVADAVDDIVVAVVEDVKVEAKDVARAGMRALLADLRAHPTFQNYVPKVLLVLVGFVAGHTYGEQVFAAIIP